MSSTPTASDTTQLAFSNAMALAHTQKNASLAQQAVALDPARVHVGGLKRELQS
jgi:hypothetical protein